MPPPAERAALEARPLHQGRVRDHLRHQFYRPWVVRMTEGRWRPPQIEPDLALLRKPTNDLQVTWLGHSSFLVQLDGLNLLLDPVLGRTCGWVVRRRGKVPIRPSQLPRIDAVLISHAHYDHLDLPTLRRLRSHPPIFGPVGLANWLKDRGFDQVTDMEWWSRKYLGKIKLDFVPAKHWSGRAPWEKCECHWGGFVIRGRSQSLYFAGDTAYFEGFAEIGHEFPGLDLALLPIGAYQPRMLARRAHMDPEEALQAFHDLGAAELIPMHWGTFRLSDEPLGGPAQKMEALWSKGNLPTEGLHVLSIGETLLK